MIHSTLLFKLGKDFLEELKHIKGRPLCDVCLPKNQQRPTCDCVTSAGCYKSVCLQSNPLRHFTIRFWFEKCFQSNFGNILWSKHSSVRHLDILNILFVSRSLIFKRQGTRITIKMYVFEFMWRRHLNQLH